MLGLLLYHLYRWQSFYTALHDLDQQVTQLSRHRDHRDVPCGQLLVAPAFLRSCSLCERTEYGCQHRVSGAGDVGVWQMPSGLARKPDGTLEGLKRLNNELGGKPEGILFVGDRECFDGLWWYAYSFTRNPGRFSVALTSLGRNEVEHTLAVFWYPSIQIHQMGELLSHDLSNRRYYYPAIAVADKHHVLEVLVLDHPEDILHVRVQPVYAAQQVRTLPEAGESRCVHLMATSFQMRDHSLPTPSALPATVHKHECRHVNLLFLSWTT